MRRGLPVLGDDAFCDMLEGEDIPNEQARPNSVTVKLANIRYHNEVAEDYEGSCSAFHVYRSACQRRIADTLSKAAARSSGVLLDVCCGTGNVMDKARPYFQHILGVDISLNMLRLAQKKGLPVLAADAFNLPLREESVDCVTAFSALHHLYDYSSVIKDMARVLKPGGTLYTDWDPNRKARSGWLFPAVVAAWKMMSRLGTEKGSTETGFQSMAEFHHFSETGINSALIEETLRAEGFRQARLIYHPNPASFDSQAWGLYGFIGAALKCLSFVRPTRENAMPWLAILAVK